MEIQVGGGAVSLGVSGAVTYPSVLPEEQVRSSLRLREDVLIVGVQIGEALIGGMGRNPQVLRRRLARIWLSGFTAWSESGRVLTWMDWYGRCASEASLRSKRDTAGDW